MISNPYVVKYIVDHLAERPEGMSGRQLLWLCSNGNSPVRVGKLVAREILNQLVRDGTVVLMRGQDVRYQLPFDKWVAAVAT